MLFLQSGDWVHHCSLAGREDGPALVFINSLGTDLRIWDRVVPQFAGRFRVVRYDKRGHGLTDTPSGRYAIADYARDLAGLLDRLAIGDAIFCGLSIGGMIAQELAATDPARVRALILCDTATRIGTPAMWEERIALVRSAGLDPLVGPSLERWFTKDFRRRRSAEARGYANMLLRTPVEGYVGACFALRDADLSARAGSIHKPALVLCGEHDVATPPDLAESLARAIPDARFALIEQAAHLPCIEQPEIVGRAIMEFLEEKSLVQQPIP
jgi:3-oxoadipate enol-lactonase